MHCKRALVALTGIVMVAALPRRAWADEPAGSQALEPSATPPAPPPPGEPEVAPAAAPPAGQKAAETPTPEFPFDAFLATPDDPRIPNFLRALRLGQDSLLLGGYLQPGFRYVTDTEFNQDDSDGFEFGNARLIGRGDLTIYKKFGVQMRFDFDVNNGNFAVKDVFGTFYWDKDLVALDIGQLKVPFSFAQLQSEAKLQFPIQSALAKLGFNRDLGVKIRSDFPLGGPVWGHVSAMIANGEGGFRQRRNLDDQFLYAGRIALSPLGRMTDSEPDLEESDPQFTVGFSAAHNAALGNDLGIADVGAAETRIEGDARFWWRGLSIRGEYLHGFREEIEGSPAYQRYGGSAQIGYVLPIPIPFPKFEIVSRFEQTDLNDTLDGTEGEDYVVDNTTTRLLQFGANVYVAKHAAKVSFMYQLTDLLEGPKVDANGDVLIGDTIFVYTQFAWL